MPTDSDSKLSSESQKSQSGWLTRCIPFSVRERRTSPGETEMPVRAIADSPKKRKRALSPHSNRKIPIHAGQVKSIDMSLDNATVGDLFDAALGDSNKINAYIQQHQKFVNLEEENAWDREAKPKPNSRAKNDMIERRAAVIIQAIREYERNVVFGNLASEAIPDADTRDMGGQFLTNKPRIDAESKLYEIAQMVPKGCLLHLHFNAELHPERLLQKAREIPDMYIRSIRPLINLRDLDLTETVFNVLDHDKVEKGVDIFAPDYPGTATNWRTEEYKWKIWMLWSDFQKRFEEKFGKEYAQQEDSFIIETPTCCAEPGQVSLHPAENWLKKKMVLSEKEAYDSTQTVNGVWARFNQATRCFKGLLNYEGVYKWYIGGAIDRMIDEKVMYAELRPMLLDKFIPTNDGKGEIDNPSQMQIIIDGVKEKQEELRKQGKLHKFPFGLKIVYCTPRSIPKSMMQREMKQCIELKLQYPDLICGFDLVGAEDRPNHIGYYKEELIAFQQTCKEKQIEIPFLFHAGETLLDTGGSADPRNSNLYDAVILESKRIGHGFALMKHPHLVEKFRRSKTSKGICVELCPISNELLHLCRNIKEHPFPELLAAGIPCTVNSDNPSLFSNSMSHEFYQILVGAPTMTLYSWKQLVRWSIEYSCLNEKQQIQGHQILESDWKQFCQDVVDKFGPLMAGDEVNKNVATGETDLAYPKRHQVATV
ncbi:hypothetical protein ACN47E_002025 [Coniothyrium glycines]